LRRGLCGLLIVPLAAGPAAADATRVAVAPIGVLTEGTGKIGAVEAALAGGIAAVPGHDVVPAAEVRQALERAHRRDLLACEGDAGCLAQIARTVGATVAVGGDASLLAGAQVVYLKAVSTAGAELGATTMVLDGKVDPATAARAAAFRLLAARDYVGTLAVHADVAGAAVYVDGHGVGTVPLAPLPVPVGTHALRVTHPMYRDFVRFVEVRFGERSDLDVRLADLGVVSSDLRVEASRPFYQKPWVLVGAGVALAAVVAVVVVVWFPPGPTRDRDVTVSTPH
jgi:hypothetical protein